MGANTYGRQVVVSLANKSGGSVAAGDVVVIDTTNNDAFTTDTAGAFTGGVGVAQETIANNGTGKVLTAGYAALVNVNASVTRGQYGKTHTVAKQATGTASRGTGTFCQWLTGGTTPDAIVYPVDLLGSSLSDPMTSRGDIIVRNASNVTARLAKGAAATVLTSDGTDVAYAAIPTAAAGVLQSAIATRTAGDVTTTSTTFVDLTGITVTLTTGAHRCMVWFVASGKNSLSGANVAYDIAIDGTLQGQTYGLQIIDPGTATTANLPVSIFLLTGVLSAASHTIKIQWRVDGGTGTTYASTGVTPATLTVIETGLTT